MLQEMTLQTSLLSAALDEQDTTSGKHVAVPARVNIRWILDTLDAERKGRFIRLVNERVRSAMITAGNCKALIGKECG